MPGLVPGPDFPPQASELTATKITSTCKAVTGWLTRLRTRFARLATPSSMPFFPQATKLPQDTITAHASQRLLAQSRHPKASWPRPPVTILTRKDPTPQQPGGTSPSTVHKCPCSWVTSTHPLKHSSPNGATLLLVQIILPRRQRHIPRPPQPPLGSPQPCQSSPC